MSSKFQSVATGQLGIMITQVVEEWLREERDDRMKREAEEKKNPTKKAVKDPFGNRHMAYFR